MSSPMTETVHFKVTVRARQHGERWAALCLQTGVVTYADTREAAEAKNCRVNVSLVEELKKHGREAVNVYFEERDMLPSIDGGDAPQAELAGMRLAA